MKTLFKTTGVGRKKNRTRQYQKWRRTTNETNYNNYDGSKLGQNLLGIQISCHFKYLKWINFRVGLIFAVRFSAKINPMRKSISLKKSYYFQLFFLTKFYSTCSLKVHYSGDFLIIGPRNIKDYNQNLSKKPVSHINYICKESKTKQPLQKCPDFVKIIQFLRTFLWFTTPKLKTRSKIRLII